MAITLVSSAFQQNGEIPARYTCDGPNISPPLEWTGVPANAKSLALIVDDPDAPDPAAPRATWVHWVLFNIPPDASVLPENSTSANLPSGTAQGVNDWHRACYGGPCPPVGKHRYFFKLYALDIVIAYLAHPTKAALEKAMRGHITAQAELVGLYKRRR